MICHDKKGGIVMKVGIFLIVATVLYGLSGLVMLLAPEQFFKPQGITLDDIGRLLAHALGATSIGFAVIFWQVRKAESSSALRAILLGSAVYIIIEVAVLVIGVLSGIGNAMAWVGIAIDLLLAIGFVYFYFQLAKSSAAQQSSINKK